MHTGNPIVPVSPLRCNTSLLEEGKIMLRLNHDRVVKLLGIILEDGNYSLVMEYVRKGNLMSVLKAVSREHD